MRYTPEIINELQDNEIFVFGSNLSGIHGGGAARQAMQWGAIYGQGILRQGRTYAIPTKSEGIKRSLTIEEIKPYVDGFIFYAKAKRELTFLVTKIGCGLAGYTVEDIAPLFKEAIGIPNIILPKEFHELNK